MIPVLVRWTLYTLEKTKSSNNFFFSLSLDKTNHKSGLTGYGIDGITHKSY